MIPVYKIRYKNTDIAFYLSRVGVPACVVGFEEIVAMGAKKFVLFGSCGELDDDNVKNKLIIPISAIRDEGTSYHYIAPLPEIEADPHSVKIPQDTGKHFVKLRLPLYKRKNLDFRRNLQRNASTYSGT